MTPMIKLRKYSAVLLILCAAMAVLMLTGVLILRHQTEKGLALAREKQSQHLQVLAQTRKELAHARQYQHWFANTTKIASITTFKQILKSIDIRAGTVTLLSHHIRNPPDGKAEPHEHLYHLKLQLHHGGALWQFNKSLHEYYQEQFSGTECTLARNVQEKSFAVYGQCQVRVLCRHVHEGQL